jgi:hypothetical protein
VPRGRRVLLDDEDPGAHPTDRELLVALDRRILDLHRGDSRERRAVAQEGHEPLELLRGALGVKPHRAVLAVAHPPCQAELACSPNGRVAKAHPLHIAVDETADRDARRRSGSVRIHHGGHRDITRIRSPPSVGPVGEDPCVSPSVDTHGRWPWASAAAAAPAAALALARRDRLAEDGRWIAWLAFPILVAHQTEEWVLPGGFLPFANDMLGSADPVYPLTERMGFWINVPLGWGTAIGGALLWRRSPALAAGVLGMELANAAMHGGMAVRRRAYNPGSLTGPLLMGTHALAGAAWLARSGRMTPGSAAVAAAGLATLITLPVGLRRRMRRR